MKLNKVRKGEYRTEVREGISLWIVREKDGGWFWFLGGYDPGLGAWATTKVGSFPTRKEAFADALVYYEEYLD